MIYALARAVAESLRDRKFPVPVLYGPEHLARGITNSVILVERDRQQGDTWETAHGTQRNPRRFATRMVGAQALIWAKASVEAARVNEHEDLCEQLVDAFFVAATEYMHETARMPALSISESGYVTKLPDGSLVPSTWPGVVYRMRWRMPRGVTALDFQGAGLPEADVLGTGGEVRVRRKGADTPEIVTLP